MKKFTGAGIIPYLIKNKKVYFIIYKNRSKQTYEDLGGKNDKTDRSIYHTASRESFEESGKYFYFKEDKLKKCKNVTLKEYICFLLDLPF